MAKSQALIDAEARVKALEEQAQEREQLKALEDKEAELQLSLVTQDKDDALKEVEELQKEVKLSKEAEERMTKEIEAMADQPVTIVDGRVVGTGIQVLSPDAYEAECTKRGRIMGRRKGQKTKPSIEELRVTINAGRKPSWFLRKTGIDAEELKQLVWKLSKKEMRDAPVKYSIEQDFFSQEG